jgi:hypothetical protein
MKQLDIAKGIVASVQADIQALANDPPLDPEALEVELDDLVDRLDEALGAICTADVLANGDDLMEKAKETINDNK